MEAIGICSHDINDSLEPSLTESLGTKFAFNVHGVKSEVDSDRVAFSGFSAEFSATKLVRANCIGKAAYAREIRRIGAL